LNKEFLISIDSNLDKHETQNRNCNERKGDQNQANYEHLEAKQTYQTEHKTGSQSHREPSIDVLGVLGVLGVEELNSLRLRLFQQS
jgi:hypothetical protein